MKKRLVFCRFSSIILLLLSIAILIFGQNSAEGASKKKRVEDSVPSPRMSPWSLRHRYTFSWEDMGIDFDEFNGDWRIFSTSANSYIENGIIEGYGPTVYLEGGEIIEAYQIGNAITERESIESVFGNGKNFTAVFPAKNGIVIKQRITTFSNYSFVIFTTSITNGGTSPISVKKIRVLGFPQSGGNLQRNIGKVTLIPVENVAGFWRYAGKDNSQVVEFASVDGLKHIIFAVASQGKGKSKVIFGGESTVAEGGIECEYNPSLILKPGETMESDAVVVSFGNYYGKILNNVCWGVSGISQVVSKNSFPNKARRWIQALPEKSTQSNLQKIADFSKSVGINDILIPEGWEKPLGSCKGDTQKYSSNMKSVVESLGGGKSLNVGLVLNPWVVPTGSEYSIDTNEGYAIVNYTQPDGIKVAEKRWNKIKEWGINFIICKVDIPEKVLRELNSTKEEATAIGMRELSRFFDRVSVYPSFSNDIIASKSALFEYITFVSQAYEAGGGIAPSMIDNNLLLDLDEFTLFGMNSKSQVWAWVGDFNKGGVKEKLISVKDAYDWVLSPLCKVGDDIPIWRIRRINNLDGIEAPQLLCVQASIMKLDENFISNCVDAGERMLWNISESNVVDKILNVRFDNQPYVILGVVGKSEIPAVIGIKGKKLGGIGEIKNIKWVGEEKKLTVNLSSYFTGSEELIIYIPSNIRLKKMLIDNKPYKNFVVSGSFVRINLKSSIEFVELSFE